MIPEAYWHFRDEFEKATDPAFHPIEWLDQVVQDGRAAMLATDNAAILFEVRDYPGGARAIEGLVAAGELSEIVGQLIPRAEEVARSLGCTHAIISSRDGWARALKDQDYLPRQTVLRKEL